MSDDLVKVLPSCRTIIENKLLTALEDRECVAILSNEEDLDLIIKGLEPSIATGATTWSCAAKSGQ